MAEPRKTRAERLAEANRKAAAPKSAAPAKTAPPAQTRQTRAERLAEANKKAAAKKTADPKKTAPPAKKAAAAAPPAAPVPPAAPPARAAAPPSQSGQKAYLELETGGRITCLFNPAEFSMSKSNQWESDHVPGRSAPDLFFTGGQAGTISLQLVFDTTNDGSAVTAHTNKLLEAMKVNAELPGHDPDRNRGRPPWVKFHWGDLHSFKAVITSLDLSFTYFSSGGTPLRAKASISLTQYEEDAQWGPQNPTSGTPQPHRVHQFRLGDTLDRLAARYYGDSTQWRLIARANNVVDPLGIAPGTMLVIPKQQGALRAS